MLESTEEEPKPNKIMSLFQMGLGEEEEKSVKNGSVKLPINAEKVLPRTHSIREKAKQPEVFPSTHSIQKIETLPKDTRKESMDWDLGTSFDDLYYEGSSKSVFKKSNRARKRSKDWNYGKKNSRPRERSLESSKPRKNRYLDYEEPQRSLGDLYYKKKYDKNCYPLIVSTSEKSNRRDIEDRALKIKDYIGKKKKIVKREKPKSGSYASNSIKQCHMDMFYKDQSHSMQKYNRYIDLPRQHHSLHCTSPEIYPPDIQFSASSSDIESYYSGREEGIFSNQKKNVRESSYTRTRHGTISLEGTLPAVASRSLCQKRAVKYWTAEESPSYDLREKLERKRTNTESSLSVNTEPVPKITRIVKATFENIAPALEQMPLKTLLSLISSKLDSTPIDDDEEEKLLLDVNAKIKISLNAYKANKPSMFLQEAPAFVLQKLKEILLQSNIVVEDKKQQYPIKDEENSFKFLEQNEPEKDANQDQPFSSVGSEKLGISRKLKKDLYHWYRTSSIPVQKQDSSITQPDSSIPDPKPSCTSPSPSRSPIVFP